MCDGNERTACMMGRNKQVVLEKGAKKGHMEKTVELHIWRKVHSYKDKGHHQEVPIKAITEVRKETRAYSVWRGGASCLSGVWDDSR